MLDVQTWAKTSVALSKLRPVWCPYSGREKHPKDKVLRQDIPGTSGTQTSGSWTKTLCKWPFSVVLGTEWPGFPGFVSGRPRFGKTLYKKTLG